MDCKEIQPVHSKGDQSWVFIGRTDAEAETPILWLPHAQSWFIGKDPDAGKDWEWEEKGTTEDEMAGWYHWLDRHELEWTLGVGDGQGGLACCISWGRKESDTLSDWTELNWKEQMAHQVKNLPAMQETQEIQVGSLAQEDPLEEGIAIHCSTLAWRIPWSEEPGGLLSMRLQGVWEGWGNKLTTKHTEEQRTLLNAKSPNHNINLPGWENCVRSRNMRFYSSWIYLQLGTTPLLLEITVLQLVLGLEKKRNRLAGIKQDFPSGSPDLHVEISHQISVSNYTGHCLTSRAGEIFLFLISHSNFYGQKGKSCKPKECKHSL